MTNPVSVVVPAAEFAGPVFWRRANATAAERGHGEHAVMLVGQVDPTSVYWLRCQSCDVTIIEITIDRSGAGTLVG